MPVEAEVVEVGEVPHGGESGEVFETDEHAEVFTVREVGSCGGVDEDPEMVVGEVGGSEAGRYAGDFSFPSDVADCFGPGGGDFDEDVVFEDLLRFVVDEAIDEKDVEMIFVACRLILVGRWTFGVGACQDLAIDLLADFSW